jgi:hypothetical protein
MLTSVLTGLSSSDERQERYHRNFVSQEQFDRPSGLWIDLDWCDCLTQRLEFDLGRIGQVGPPIMIEFGWIDLD